MQIYFFKICINENLYNIGYIFLQIWIFRLIIT